MFKRKIYDELLKWKKNKNQECLLVKGARQVGKSYIIRKFGQEYKSFIEINFYERPELKEIFNGSLEPKEIYKKISLYFPNTKFIEKNTLIFFDEIQHCPNARTAIKFLAIDNKYDIISSGSLLGLHYNEIESIPVGYEKQIEMYSLDFEEFLWACGYENAIEILESYFINKEQIPNGVNDKYHNLIREYMVVGGMPDVVKVYLKENNFNSVYEKQQSILKEYEDDFNKYSSIPERQKIRDSYYSLPRQLSKEYTKFQYKTIEKNGSFKKYESSLEWLVDAGMIKKVYNVSFPMVPLKAYIRIDQYKIYGTDIGLVTSMFGLETQISLINNTLKGPAKGGIYENLIFDILNKRNIYTNYYKKDDSTQEIEFLIENDGVIPIEVKSSQGTTLSLDAFIKSYNPNCAYKLTNGNVGEHNNLITLPHYLSIFINKE